MLIADRRELLNHSRLRAQLLCELGRAPLRVAVAEELRLFLFEREVNSRHALKFARARERVCRWLDFANLLLLRRHDAFERSVANLADARLNREQAGRLHRVPLVPTALKLALDAQLLARIINLDDDCRVRESEKLCEYDARLPVAVVVGLQSR